MTSCGQVCYYFSQVDLWSDLPPLGEALGQVDIFVRSSGQVGMWSDVPPGQRHLVAKCVTSLFRLVFGQMDPPVGEASGEVDFFVRSLGQADLWSDVPP